MRPVAFAKVPLSVVLVIVCGGLISAISLDIETQHDILRTRRQSACKRSEFSCNNGQCISTFDKCDGTKHCRDGSDETSTVCGESGHECPLMSFLCSYGACVDGEFKCDGKVDCADASDEKNCSRPLPINNRIPSTNPCGNLKYQCSSGQCINAFDICDGTRNCNDGSDETKDLCWNFDCPDGSFKCSYGACLDPTLKCNGYADCFDGSDETGNCPKPVVLNVIPTATRAPPTRPPPPPPPSQTYGGVSSDPGPSTGSCKLPPHPKDGAYVLSQCSSNDPRTECRNTPGTLVPSTWLLRYTCNDGYSLNKDSDYSICEDGIWKNPLDCIKLCPPLKSQSVNVRCFFGGAEINCTSPMKPDTHATAECKTHYRPASLPEYSTLACLRNGQWSYPLFYCQADCGVRNEPPRSVNNRITEGHIVTPGELPWLAALYYLNNSTLWEQRCGGTLITPHIVITAAHCLVNNHIENIRLHPNDIRVGLGKYKRDFYANEPSAIITEVKEVIIPPQYSGQPSQYARDIGLLDLMVSVQVTAIIMPACVDWSIRAPFVPPAEAEGVVAGWGLTEIGGASSDVVLSARLKYISYNDCLKKLRAGNRYYLSHDKFCAGDVDGSQVNSGDSGGGLTFLKDGKHFLIGVVSTRIPEFSFFSDITNKEHSVWLEKEKNRLKLSHIES